MSKTLTSPTTGSSALPDQVETGQQGDKAGDAPPVTGLTEEAGILADDYKGYTENWTLDDVSVYPDVDKRKPEEPLKRGPSDDLEKKTFTIDEYLNYLRRAGIPDDLVKRACSLAFAEVAPAPAHDATADARPSPAHTTAQAPGDLPWPTETYSEADMNIVQFLETYYAALIKTGAVTRKSLRDHDPSAEKAYTNYLYATREKPDDDGRKRLLSDLHLVTKREVHDCIISVDRDAIARNPKLAQVVATRLRRGVPVPI